MINSFPDRYELVSFFKTDAELFEVDVPWHYNIISFNSLKGDERVIAAFSPAYGDLDLTIERGGE